MNIEDIFTQKRECIIPLKTLVYEYEPLSLLLLFVQTYFAISSLVTKTNFQPIRKMYSSIVNYPFIENMYQLVLDASATSQKLKSGDKRYPCPFCDKHLAKLPRHLKSAHKNENDRDLQQYLATGDNAALTKVRNRGRHYWNQQVCKTGKGTIEPVYRSKTFSSHNDLVTCMHCLGWFGKNELWRHVSRCSANKNKNSLERNTKRIGRLIRDSHVKASTKFSEVLSTFKDDDVALVVKNDPLIKEWGERLCLTHGHNKTRYRNIRSRLRRVANVLITLRKLQPAIVRFADSVLASNYNLLQQAAHTL